MYAVSRGARTIISWRAIENVGPSTVPQGSFLIVETTSRYVRSAWPSVYGRAEGVERNGITLRSDACWEGEYYGGLF